jgi:two-component system, LuxR family, response regulator FixJ
MEKRAHTTLAPRTKMMARDTIVYLVDDDSAVRDSLKLLLEAHGIAVRDFGSAAQLLREAAPGKEDCLICDVHMPVMSGIDLIETLARRGEAPPTILITGRGDDALFRRARAAGAYLVLEKPFDGDLLIEAIDRAVAAHVPAFRH